MTGVENEKGIQNQGGYCERILCRNALPPSMYINEKVVFNRLGQGGLLVQGGWMAADRYHHLALHET